MLSLPLAIVAALVLIALSAAAGYYFFRARYLDQEGQLVEPELLHRSPPATHRGSTAPRALGPGPLAELTTSVQAVRSALADRSGKGLDPASELELDQRLDQLGAALQTMGDAGFDPVAVSGEHRRLKQALAEAEAGRRSAEAALTDAPPPAAEGAAEGLESNYEAVVRDRDALRAMLDDYNEKQSALRDMLDALRVALQQKDAEVQQMRAEAHATASEHAPPDVQDTLARLTAERDEAVARVDAAVTHSHEEQTRLLQQFEEERAVFAQREAEWTARFATHEPSAASTPEDQACLLYTSPSPRD